MKLHPLEIILFLHSYCSRWHTTSSKSLRLCRDWYTKSCRTRKRSCSATDAESFLSTKKMARYFTKFRIHWSLVCEPWQDSRFKANAETSNTETRVNVQETHFCVFDNESQTRSTLSSRQIIMNTYACSYFCCRWQLKPPSCFLQIV